MAARSDTERVSAPRRRLRLRVVGAVQGVGFRPFVYRLATELSLGGWVNNSPSGVTIEVEGAGENLDEFRRRFDREKPPRASIQGLEATELDAAGFVGFEIRASEQGGEKSAVVLPDIATCDDCLSEIFDPANRRHLYAFTNCTNCGPRYSIITAIPYDRPNTTMCTFRMCAACAAEYSDPMDRRFHAQPIACPECGPRLALWDGAGTHVATGHDALRQAAAAVLDGRILALKGIGGFQLIADAGREDVVSRLRSLKRRDEKPFAIMCTKLDEACEMCEVGEAERRLLLSPEAPIVLLRRQATEAVAGNVAPGNPYLGVMIPYSPLHHIFMKEVGRPVVATSGNLSDEPICTDEGEALARLSGIADFYLVHDRPIARHVDDSIVRVAAGRELVLRRARGYAPLPLALARPVAPTLAVGAHLKNTVSLAVGRQVFTSQHIGDLETVQAYDAFRGVVESLSELFETSPQRVVADLHPDYMSTQYALGSGLPVMRVQHHQAHVFACMAENEVAPPCLGVAWDGTGLGDDGSIWGGEIFRVDADSQIRRVAHMRTFRLPGGERAIREPRRSALGLLYEIWGRAALEHSNLAPLRDTPRDELQTMLDMLDRRVNAPVTSSAGRLFDAVASITGIRQTMRFEGQAAMELEFALESVSTSDTYPMAIRSAGGMIVIDWQPLIEGIVRDVQAAVSVGLISARFHNGLAQAIVAVAREVGEEKVLMSGGCFQNRYLLEQSIRRLRASGFRPYWHQRIPPNDGGIALGQIWAVAIGG